MRLPRRYDERILRAECNRLVLDGDLAFALAAMEYRAIGAAIALPGKSRRQQLHERCDGRHGKAARCRIDELHLVAVRGVRGSGAAQALERLARTRIRIS